MQGADAVGSHARTQGQVQTQEESQARGENPTKIQTSILPTRSDRTNLTLDELDGKKNKAGVLVLYRIIACWMEIYFNIWWLNCWWGGFYVQGNVRFVEGRRVQQLASIFGPKTVSLWNIPARIWHSVGERQADLMIERHLCMWVTGGQNAHERSVAGTTALSSHLNNSLCLKVRAEVQSLVDLFTCIHPERCC